MIQPFTRFRCSAANMERKTAFARQMRNNPTPAEKHLWFYLRCCKLGIKFGRQRLILGWIVDFYSPQLKLVVEVDGSAHNNTTDYDDHRDSVMQLHGFKVIRFTNEQVFQNTSTVLSQIRIAMQQL